MSDEAIQVTTTDAAAVVPVETTSCDEWRACVRLRGQLDLAYAPRVLAELRAHIDAGRGTILVDTSEVEFLDSTVMGALVEADALCRASQGSLILTNLPARLHRLLSIAGLDRMLLVDTAAREPHRSQR